MLESKHRYIPLEELPLRPTQPLKRQRLHALLTATLLISTLLLTTYTVLSPVRTPHTASGTFHLRKQFTSHPTLQNLSTSYDRFCDPLLPPIHIAIDPDRPQDLSGMGMFHQMHCLHEIRTEMQRLHGYVEKRTVGEDLADLRDLHRRHYLHCFDYLAQSILCCADGTIEPHVEHPTSLFERIVGEGTWHECRSSDELYKFIEETGTPQGWREGEPLPVG